LSIIQGPFSVAPCPTLALRFATFSIAVSGSWLSRGAHLELDGASPAVTHTAPFLRADDAAKASGAAVLDAKERCKELARRAKEAERQLADREARLASAQLHSAASHEASCTATARAENDAAAAAAATGESLTLRR
jgi:hypothetical protein